MPIYMKVDGIKGTGTGKHQGWIVLDSCQFGMHRHVKSPVGSSSNREASVPTVREIVVTKFQDDSSTALFQWSVDGKGKNVTIEFTKSESDTAYMTIELENVFITSYSLSGAGGDSKGKPHESISLGFQKMQFKTASAPSANERNQWRSLVDLRGS